MDENFIKGFEKEAGVWSGMASGAQWLGTQAKAFHRRFGVGGGAAVGAGAGALGGAVTGAVSGGEGNRGRGALAGALTGATLGVGLGANAGLVAKGLAKTQRWAKTKAKAVPVPKAETVADAANATR